MKDGNKSRLLFLLFAMFFIFALNGCASQPVAVPQQSEPLQPISNIVGTFDDIELPPEMKYSPAKSLSLRNSSFKGGVYVYNGRVDVSSLKEYILVSMQNNRWKFNGENNVKKDTVLAYTKPNKTCLFIISNKILGTKITLVISENVGASTKLNPFGEPVN